MQNPIEIPLSKTKLFLLELASIAFVVGSIWMIMTATTQTRYNPYILKIVGVVGILFFGITSIYVLIKLFDKKPGLIITSEGIHDNSTALSIGLIMWDDIIGFRTIEIASTKLLKIYVSNLDYYIDLATSAWKRRLMNSNHKTYGSPISISSNSLKIKYKEFRITFTRPLERK